MAKGDIISRLKIESGEFDSKIKRAGQELLAYSEHCRKVGIEMGYANKDAKEFAKALGSMQTVSQTARGKINELSEAFVNAKVMYKNMTETEKASPFGRDLAASLDQLKSRLNEAKKDLADVQQELNASGNKFGQFGSVIDGIGQKMGINANLTELLTSKTALMSAGIGASVAIIGKATEEWAKYNSELAKQDQITTVTTGVKGPGADRMTDQARALVDTYGVDFREAINAANTLMTQFGKSGEEAMDLIRQGMQGMIQGDGPKLLSMIQQYAPSFRDAGIEASQLVAIIQNSEGGIFTDQNMNAIVMGIKNIRLMTKATSDALAQLGIDGQKMSKDLSDGTITIFDAMKQVVDQLQKVESGSQTAGEVMQQVFGRQGTAAGANLAKAIATLNTNLEETKRQTGEVGQSYDALYEANVKLNQAIRACFEYDGWEQMATGIKVKLVTALADVLDVTSKIKDSWVGDVGRTIFDTMTDAALKASGTLGTVLSLLKNINSESGKGNDGNNGGIGTSDIDKTLQYIGNGANQQERETRYDKAIAQLRQKLDNIGKERRVNNADGSVSYKIDSQDVQDQKRAALERRISILEKQRDSVVNKPEPPKITNNGSLGKNGGKSTSHATTPAQRAAENINTAEQEYSRALEKAALEVKGGTITEAQQKQKQLQATEALWTAYGKASDMVNGSNADYKAKQVELGQRIVELGGEVKVATAAQKLLEEQSRKNAAAWKKLEESSVALYAAQNQNDLKAFYKARDQYKAAGGENDIQAKAAQVKSVTATVTINADDTEALRKLQEVDGVTIDPKTLTVTATTEEALRKLQEVDGVTIDPKTVKVEYQDGGFSSTTANIKAFIDNLKERIANSEVGTDLYNALTAQLADATALSNLLQTAIKNGIDPAQIGLDQKEFWSKVFGENPGDYIEDSTWQSIEDTINEKLAEMRIDPIKIDVKTGEVKSQAKELKADWKDAASAIQSVGSAMAAIEDPAAKVIGTIAQAVAGVALGASQAIGLAGNGSAGGPWGWITFAAAATATMVSTIASIHSATGYANGGIVDGRGGGFVGGNAFSGDNIGNVRLNAGELVLNRSQQSTLAESLESRGSYVQSFQPYVSGENVYLGINNHLGRSGQGELVTTDMLRRIGLM